MLEAGGSWVLRPSARGPELLPGGASLRSSDAMGRLELDAELIMQDAGFKGTVFTISSAVTMPHSLDL